MDQTSATTPDAAPQQAPDASRAAGAGRTPDAAQAPESATATQDPPPGFRTRGRLRRRLRYLRKARELAYRDLGGLIFDLHRYGQRNDPLVIAKLGTLSQLDNELRALQAALNERQPLTVLREAGITACPRCAAIHSGEDRFCPNCGLPMSRHVDLPIAAPSAPAPAAPIVGPGAVVKGSGASATTPAPGPTPATSPAPASAPGAGTSPSPARAAPSTPAPRPPADAAAGPSAPPAGPAPGAAPPQAPATAAPVAAPAASQGSPAVPAGAPVDPLQGAPRAPRAPAAPPASSEEEPTEIIRPPAGA